MISAIQTKLQKHNKVVFFVLLAVIIVAFVFTIGAAPGLGGDQRTARQDFFGYNLQSDRDMREISRLGTISYRIEHDQHPSDHQRFENFLVERIALLGLADELRIPAPNADQFRDFVSRRPAFQNEQGQFDRNKFEFFIDDVEADPLISSGDVSLIVEQDFRIERARKLLSGPGYILPTEVRLELERTKTLWSLDFATFDLSTFDPEIEISDEDLESFFEENDFRYERSPRIDFAYAHFDRTKFLDRVGEHSESELEEHFRRNRDRFTPPEPAEEPEEGEEAEDQEVTLADVRDQVEEDLSLRKARRLAGHEAADFAYALFREGVLPGEDAFDELLETHRGELRDAPPSNRENFPQELNFPQDVQQWVFRLSEDRRFSDPLEVNNNYVVLLYEETLPAYIPEIAEIRDRVESDYRSEERRRLLSEKGEEIRTAINNQLKEGASFLEAAEAEGLETESLEPFALTPPFPPELPQQLIGRLDDFRKGEVSPMTSVQNSGYFIFVRDKEVPEIDRTGEEFVQTEDRIRMFSTMSGQQMVLQEFIQRKTNLGGQAQ